MELKIILAYIYIILALLYIHFGQIQRYFAKKKIKQIEEPLPIPDPKSVMGESRYVHKPIKEVVKTEIATSENEVIKEEGSESKRNAVIPPERLNDVFSETKELDLDIELGYKKEEKEIEEDFDFDEEEEELKNGTYDKDNLAQGQSFEQISNSINTIYNIRATKKEEIEAGRVLYSIEDTQLFNQINSASAKNELRVANLIVLHIENHNKGIA